MSEQNQLSDIFNQLGITANIHNAGYSIPNTQWKLPKDLPPPAEYINVATIDFIFDQQQNYLGYYDTIQKEFVRRGEISQSER